MVRVGKVIATTANSRSCSEGDHGVAKVVVVVMMAVVVADKRFGLQLLRIFPFACFCLIVYYLFVSVLVCFFLHCFLAGDMLFNWLNCRFLILSFLFCAVLFLCF